MNSHTEDLKDYLLGISSNVGKLKNVNRSGTPSIVARQMAKRLDDLRMMNGYLPNRDGEVIFEVSYRQFMGAACYNEITASLRNNLIKYGYRMKTHNKYRIVFVYNV